MWASLPVLNLAEAKFECIYGRGCDGICCQNGPRLFIPKRSPSLIPICRTFSRYGAGKHAGPDREAGISQPPDKAGLPMLRVVDGWCVFFNQGCVLHKAGAAEGDKYRYKPAWCAFFPLARTEQGDWYVRQRDFEGEDWELFCLDPPCSTSVPAAQSLQAELALA